MQRSGFNYSIAAIRSPTWPRYIPRCEASRVGSWLTECLMLQWNAENEIKDTPHPAKWQLSLVLRMKQPGVGSFKS
jgi:hypothetical protein